MNRYCDVIDILFFIMETILYPLLLTLFAGLATGIGSIIAFVAHRTSRGFFSFTLGLSAGVMLYVSFVELFDQSRTLFADVWGGRLGELGVALFFFAGMGVIGLIDKLVPSFENPHELRQIESLNNPVKADEGRLHHMGLLTALAIAIHNFPEGIATFMASQSNPSIGVAIAVAIALHNIPEGIAVSIPIYYATGSKKRAFAYSLMSGLAEPLGAVLAFLVLMPFMNDVVLGAVLSAVAGIMVYISIDELLPAAREYGKPHVAIWGMVVGMMIMAASLILL